MTQPSSTASSAASHPDEGGVLRRRWPWPVVLTLLGLSAGLLLQAWWPASPLVARTLVELRPIGVDLAAASPAERVTAMDAARAAVDVTSRGVRQQALQATGLDLAPDDLLDATTVAVPDSDQFPEGAPVLEVAVQLDDPAAAVVVADALARAHLEATAAVAVAERDARLAQLQVERDEVLSELSALAFRIEADRGTDGEAAALTGLQAAALQRAEAIEAEVLALRAGNVDPGRVLEPARLDAAGDPLVRRLAAAGLGLLGLVLGLATAVVVDRADRRVWGPSDLAPVTGDGLLVHATRDDLLGDGLRTGSAHRQLRTLVAPAPMAHGSILVTGASSDHGAGVAAGLATAIAASGRRTLLLDAGDADAFDVPGGDLDGWLAGRVGLDRAAHSPAGVPALQVVRGRPGQELVASSTLRELLAAPPSVVVLHVPGAAESGDALGLAGLVDRVVVVAAARQDREAVIARAHRWFARDAAEPPVVVLAG